MECTEKARETANRDLARRSNSSSPPDGRYSRYNCNTPTTDGQGANSQSATGQIQGIAGKN